MTEFNPLFEFLEQEIELYGDELALSKEHLDNFNFYQSNSTATTLQKDWTSCKDLASLKDFTLACQACSLSNTRKNVSFGDGSPHAEIMVVGDYPTFEDDSSGSVFMGPVGHLLNKILAAIELDRGHLFLTNVIKCRPPGNREPLFNEIQACKGSLVRQIEFIKPAFILCLGKLAGQTVLNTQASLKELAGKAHTVGESTVIVTFHPSTLLKFPEYKKSTWKDVQLLQKLYTDWLNLRN